MLTQEYLKSILYYEPPTGLWYWLVDRRARYGRSGQVAGRLNNKGYIEIKIDGRIYKAHRLAWFYMTGEWPNKLVEHKDRNRSNNIWTNLRLATYSQNLANIVKTSSNTSGYKGVTWNKKLNRWQVRITVNYEPIYLGLFDDLIEAAIAYDHAAIRYFGEFAYTNFPRENYQ